MTEHAGIDGWQTGKGLCFHELVATDAFQILVGQVVELNGLLDLFPEQGLKYDQSDEKSNHQTAQEQSHDCESFAKRVVPYF